MVEAWFKRALYAYIGACLYSSLLSDKFTVLEILEHSTHTHSGLVITSQGMNYGTTASSVPPRLLSVPAHAIVEDTSNPQSNPLSQSGPTLP